MSKRIGDANGEYVQANTTATRTRSPVQASDGRIWLENQNHLWARYTAEWGGYAFQPAWETTNTGYSEQSASNSRDLGTLNIMGVAERKKDNGNVEIGLEIFGTNIDVRYSVNNLVSGTQKVQQSVSASGTDAWSARTDDIVASDIAGDLVEAVIEAKSQDGNTAKLYVVRVGEVEISSTSKLPTG